HICQLNFSAMSWIQQRVTDEEIANLLMYLRCIWTTNKKVHIILKGDTRKNLIMDIEMKEWTTVNCNSSTRVCPTCRLSNHFTHKNRIYKFDTLESNYALSCFDDIQNDWVKLVDFTLESPVIICQCSTEVIMDGTRIFIITLGEEYHLRKIIILELEPTLRDRAEGEIHKNEVLKEMGKEVLPRGLVTRIHRDTRGDSLVPS
ncbi:hypothetical protein PMAYCL1PPCAC_28668, partial [Pristionchus mayeri]